VDYPDPYVQPLILRALSSPTFGLPHNLITSVSQLPSPSAPLLQFMSYEALDFDSALQHPATSLVSAYAIRKALIRKHYLSTTVSTWIVKHPESVLGKHFKPAVHFELDFAEFLDDALVDAWDLNESFARNESMPDNVQCKEWWILKPGMSDGGNGIRLFSTLEELREIFEEWDAEEEDENDDLSEAEKESNHENASEAPGGQRNGNESRNAGMTSQLRHFIAQPYIHPPLLLQSKGGRKFHIRAYVLAVGALKVYVFQEMLALFAAKPYSWPLRNTGDQEIDLAGHLTNTCFQGETTRDSSVFRFWELEEATLGSEWKRDVWEQICAVTGEVFEAAAREQIVHFQTLPNAFEIFGVDFLVDAEGNAWLLELNAYPDFKQTGDKLRETVVGVLFREVVQTAVRPFFAIPPSVGGSERMRLVRDINMGRG
jgi:tubulin--tyrosine ligase